MANIKKVINKTGPSFKITVAHGRDAGGKQIRHYMTWTPDHPMTERQMEKEVARAAYDFEREIKMGFQVDNRQSFSKYAAYVIDLKERNGVKHRTISLYKTLMERIEPAIGHIKLTELRPQHLNDFYKNLAQAGMRKDSGKAYTKIDLPALLKSKNLTKAAVSDAAGISPTTVTVACRGQKISPAKAEAIAGVLEVKTADIFTIEKDDAPLSNKTITEYHRFISTVLDQAEKEMLVQYNAASKATPPKIIRKEVNYFQPDDMVKILNCLEAEPIKWHMATHLLLITGCRRGEILGLKWSKVDFTNCQIRIDASLLYSRDIGIYEDSTKTGTTRFIKLPTETMQLLRQYRTWYLELQLSNGDRWQHTDYLFVQDNGTPMNPDSLTDWLNKFSKRHNLPHINPHAFRHTMASILISSGKDVVSVSKRLGHAKVSTTTDIYSHIIKQADEQASECLADVILRPVKKII